MDAFEEEERRTKRFEGCTRGCRPALGTGGVFKTAAVEVLRSEMRLMSTGEVCRIALKNGIIQCSGKTPEATMASAMYTDIRKKVRPLFVRPLEGAFGLKEWEENGFLERAIAQYQEDNPEKINVTKKKNAVQMQTKSSRSKRKIRWKVQGMQDSSTGSEDDMVNTKRERPLKISEAGPSMQGDRNRGKALAVDYSNLERPDSSLEEGVSLLLDAADALVEDEKEITLASDGRKVLSSFDKITAFDSPHEVALDHARNTSIESKNPTFGTVLPLGSSEKGDELEGDAAMLKLEFSSIVVPRSTGDTEEGTGVGRGDWPGISTPTSGVCVAGGATSSNRISVGDAEMELQMLEKKLGNQNPEVGRAWLKLARRLQIENNPLQARSALLHAWAIFRNCAKSLPGADDCTLDFRSLLDSTSLADPS